MTAEEIRAWLAENRRTGHRPASCYQLAKRCRVTRGSLSLVLAGKRTSRPLLEKIERLKAQQEARRKPKEAEHAPSDH